MLSCLSEFTFFYKAKFNYEKVLIIDVYLGTKGRRDRDSLRKGQFDLTYTGSGFAREFAK